MKSTQTWNAPLPVNTARQQPSASAALVLDCQEMQPAQSATCEHNQCRRRTNLSTTFPLFMSRFFLSSRPSPCETFNQLAVSPSRFRTMRGRQARVTGSVVDLRYWGETDRAPLPRNSIAACRPGLVTLEASLSVSRFGSCLWLRPQLFILLNPIGQLSWFRFTKEAPRRGTTTDD